MELRNAINLQETHLHS